MGSLALGFYVGSKQARHAVRMQVNVQSEGGSAVDGMMIELSMHGCRISRIDAARIKPGVEVKVSIEGFGAMAAQVLRAHDGVVGLRFVRPLSRGGLLAILENDRDPPLRLQPLMRFAS